MPADHDRSTPLILVADDDLTVQELTRIALENSNFAVVDAADGEEALRVFHDTRPDLVMLDVMMPKLTGFDVCAEIRVSQAGKKHPHRHGDGDRRFRVNRPRL